MTGNSIPFEVGKESWGIRLSNDEETANRAGKLQQYMRRQLRQRHLEKNKTKIPLTVTWKVARCSGVVVMRYLDIGKL